MRATCAKPYKLAKLLSRYFPPSKQLRPTPSLRSAQNPNTVVSSGIQ